MPCRSMHFDNEEHVVAFDAGLLEFVGDRDHGRLIFRVPDLGEQFDEDDVLR